MTIPLQPTEAMTIEVQPDELVVLKHMRSELHNTVECRVCRTEKWWYEKYNDGRTQGNRDGYARAVREIAEGSDS